MTRLTPIVSLRHHVHLMLFASGCAAVQMMPLDSFAASPAEAEVRAAEAEAKGLQQHLNEARLVNRKIEKRCKAYGLTADLIAGRRDTPPNVQLVEDTVVRLGEEPVTLDNRADGKRLIWQKWVALKGGRRYRVRARIGISEITGTQNFKFGMMVTRPGQEPFWPDAFVGGSPFAEKEVCFDYFCPEGGGNLFVIGFETGKGVAVFRDVRFNEVSEKLPN